MEKTQDKLRKILQESQKPLGPSEIGNVLKKPRNAIQYHLNKLIKKGTVVSNGGKYSYNKKELEELKGIEEKIIKLLSTTEYSPIGIQQKLGFDESKIFSALYQLEGAGLIKEGPTSLANRGGLIRHRRTTHDTKYCRETKYTLTYLAYSKIGVCPICKEKIRQKDLILTAFFKNTKYNIEPQPWKKVLIHLDCISDSEAYDTVYGKYDGSIFCEYCSLPLSPKMLPRQSITYKSIKCHFSEMELETIGLFEYIIQSCTTPLDFIPTMDRKNRFAIDMGALDDSTIEKAYKNFEIEIPDWISERLKNEISPKESSPENNNIEPLSWEILIYDGGSLEADLSELRGAEKFIKVLKKYRSDFPADYDTISRIKEIWTAALNIRNENEKNIQRMYEKLLEPAGIIYTYMDEAFGTEQYDFDLQKSDILYNEFSIFSQTIAFKHGNKLYHPFCAEKLGLKMTVIAITKAQKEVKRVSEKSGMTSEAASRIQSHADSTGTNQGFKARAQSTAAKKGK